MNANGWQGPASLGGHFDGDPFAVVGANGGAAVYVHGPNGNLETYWTGTNGTWNGPGSLGGKLGQ